METFNKLFDGNNDVVNTGGPENYNYTSKLPWIDKYRPKKLNDILYQYDIINILKNNMLKENLPHLLFYGPPGTGKTSTILAIANELFGKKINERVLELNASDERGINVVRHKILTFAKTSINPDNDIPSFKIIILDEADAMTIDAQSALKKMIENYSKITRFCLICNYINQIIEPILSRCMKCRFKAINIYNISLKLKEISIKENFVINDEFINKISELSKGDLRKGIIFLQHVYYINSYSNNLTINDIYECTNTISPQILSNLFNKFLLNPLITAADISKIIDIFILKSYSIYNIIEQLYNIIIQNDNITDIQKSLICTHIAHTENKLIDGSNEYIQLLNIFLYINGVLCKNITTFPEFHY